MLSLQKADQSLFLPLWSQYLRLQKVMPQGALLELDH
jgi:hypothetical protein